MANARAELLQPPQRQATASTEHQPIQELAKHGLQQHKETTATLKNVLRVARETGEVQQSISSAVQQQDAQMHRIKGGLEEINVDLKHANKLARFMRMCFICSFCCECITDPGDRPHAANSIGQIEQHQLTPKQMHKLESQTKSRISTHQHGPNVSGWKELGLADVAKGIEAETNIQNEVMDEIAMATENLLLSASALNQELTRQTDVLTTLNEDGSLTVTNVATTTRVVATIR